MHPRTAKEILANDEELDIAALAEANLEVKKHPTKPVPSVKRALAAWQRKRIRIKEEEEIKRAVAGVWKKRKDKK